MRHLDICSNYKLVFIEGKYGEGAKRIPTWAKNGEGARRNLPALHSGSMLKSSTG